MLNVDRIIKIIGDKGYTCHYVEKALGFGNGAIRRWKTNSPSIKKLFELSNFLSIDISILLLDDNKKSENTSLSDEDKEILKLYNQLDSLDKNIIKGKISEMIKGKGEEDTEFSADLAT